MAMDNFKKPQEVPKNRFIRRKATIHAIPTSMRNFYGDPLIPRIENYRPQPYFMINERNRYWQEPNPLNTRMTLNNKSDVEIRASAENQVIIMPSYKTAQIVNQNPMIGRSAIETQQAQSKPQIPNLDKESTLQNWQNAPKKNALVPPEMQRFAKTLQCDGNNRAVCNNKDTVPPLLAMPPVLKQDSIHKRLGIPNLYKESTLQNWQNVPKKNALVPPEMQRFTKTLQCDGNNRAVCNNQDTLPPLLAMPPVLNQDSIHKRQGVCKGVQADLGFFISENEYKGLQDGKDWEDGITICKQMIKFIEMRMSMDNNNSTKYPNIENQKVTLISKPKGDQLVENNKEPAPGKTGSHEEDKYLVINKTALNKLVAYSDYNKTALRQQFEAHKKNEIVEKKISDERNNEVIDMVAKNKPVAVANEKPISPKDIVKLYGDESMYVADPDAHRTPVRLHEYQNITFLKPLERPRENDAVNTTTENDISDMMYLARRRTMPVQVPTARQRPPISISPHERPTTYTTDQGHKCHGRHDAEYSYNMRLARCHYANMQQQAQYYQQIRQNVQYSNMFNVRPQWQ